MVEHLAVHGVTVQIPPQVFNVQGQVGLPGERGVRTVFKEGGNFKGKETLSRFNAPGDDTADTGVKRVGGDFFPERGARVYTIKSIAGFPEAQTYQYLPHPINYIAPQATGLGRF